MPTSPDAKSISNQSQFFFNEEHIMTPKTQVLSKTEMNFGDKIRNLKREETNISPSLFFNQLSDGEGSN